MEEFLRIYLPIALGLTSLGGTIFLWFTAPARKNADAIKVVSDTVDDLDKRMSGLETVVRSLPDAAAIHRLELSLNSISGDLRVMGEAMKSVRELAIMTRDMVAKDSH